MIPDHWWTDSINNANEFLSSLSTGQNTEFIERFTASVVGTENFRKLPLKRFLAKPYEGNLLVPLASMFSFFKTFFEHPRSSMLGHQVPLFGGFIFKFNSIKFKLLESSWTWTPGSHSRSAIIVWLSMCASLQKLPCNYPVISSTQ